MWGWVADRIGDPVGLLQKIALISTACCIIVAFVTPAWPAVLTGVLFFVFGAAAVGWNGLFLAEVARHSPRGMASIATGGAMVWNFGGVLVGPAVFAVVYGVTGSYGITFGLLSLIALAGAVLLQQCRSAALRARPA
jgi:hypothetical protein